MSSSSVLDYPIKTTNQSEHRVRQPKSRWADGSDGIVLDYFEWANTREVGLGGGGGGGGRGGLNNEKFHACTNPGMKIPYMEILPRGWFFRLKKLHG